MVEKVRTKLSKQDIENAIFIPNKAREEKPSNNDGVVVYTIAGKGDVTDKDGDYIILKNKTKRNNSDQKVKVVADLSPLAYAKTITINGKTRCFIKQGRQGKFLDPLAAIPVDNAAYIRSHGKDEWNFREVNGKVFTYYITYLKTKNRAWLINAERESI